MSPRNSEERFILNKQMCRNIYYMLVYDPDEFSNMIDSNINIENCESLDDLLAVMTTLALETWDTGRKVRGYQKENKDLDRPMGYINIYESYTNGAYAKGMLNCSFFKLEIDNKYNRIIKLAIRKLLDNEDNIRAEYTNQLRYYYNKLNDITLINYDNYVGYNINFAELPEYYIPIINTSKLVIENILYRDIIGNTDAKDVKDAARYEHIFENFVRNFYTREYHTNGAVTRRESFNTEAERENVNTKKIERYNVSYKTDIVMRIPSKNKVNIFDCKWYAKSRIEPGAVEGQLSRYKETFKDENETFTGTIIGIAISAESTKNYYNETFYKRRGLANKEVRNAIRTVNMNESFEKIKERLIEIADEFN